MQRVPQFLNPFVRSGPAALVLVTMLLTATVAGCVAPQDGQTAPADLPAELPQVGVAVLPITDVTPLYVAQAEGFDTAAGIDLNLVPVNSGAERNSMVQTGQTPCELTDLHGVVLTNVSDALQLRVVTSARQANPEQALFFMLVGPDSAITEPADLAGATIAVSENTIIDYWTDRMLDAVGVGAAGAAKTNVPQIPVRLELLLSGQVDAAVLPDPLASLAQLSGATVVVDDRSEPELAVSVIVCRADFIAEQSDAVAGLVQAWDAAVAAINADPARFRNVLIENTRVPEPLQDQYQIPPFPVEELPTEAQVDDVVAWAMEQGLIAAPLAYDQVVDVSFRR